MFHPPDQEPDVIFEVTTTKPITSYRLEGVIAGIIVGVLLLTVGLIAGIVCWNRRENRRLQEKFGDEFSGRQEAQYAVVPNPNIIAHPTWFPPPQPVYVVPLQMTDPNVSLDPRHTEYYAPSSTFSSAPSVDYYDDPEIGPISECDFVYASPYGTGDNSRARYSFMDSSTADETYSEGYYPDEDSISTEPKFIRNNS